MLPLDPPPEPSREPTEEEPLRRQEIPREPGLEKADAGPGRGHGAREEGGHAEGVGKEFSDGGKGVMVECVHAGEHEGRVDD